MRRQATGPQRRVLCFLASGRPADAGCRTMADHGGLTGTIASLHRRGWIDGAGQITDAGRAQITSPTGRIMGAGRA